MFHPLPAQCPVELTNISANIITFHVFLFEPGHHVFCTLLTGLANLNVLGLVPKAKYKIQDLILSSKMVCLTKVDHGWVIRDQLSHLQYQSCLLYTSDAADDWLVV